MTSEENLNGHDTSNYSFHQLIKRQKNAEPGTALDPQLVADFLGYSTVVRSAKLNSNSMAGK